MRGARIYYFWQLVAGELSPCITDSYLSFEGVLIFQAAVTRHRRLGGLNDGNVSSHGSGSEKSKIEVSAGSFPPRLLPSLLLP